jgi:hypothetical protein
MKYYKLSEQELSELMSDALYARALIRGGVDNWEYECNARLNFIDLCNEEDGTDYEDIDDFVPNEIARYELINGE